ncbi:hypothetical protein Tco_0788298 [Tanacetum coccineum]
MRELRRKLFAGTDDEDAHEHVRRILDIVDLFHFPSITHDAVMLRVFPITLKGRALRWKKRLPVGYDETTTKEKINDIPDNVDAIQESFKEAHPTKKCPLKKEDKVGEQSKYMRSLEETIIKFFDESIKKQATDDEWIRKFIENTESNIRAIKTTTKNLEEKAYQLTQTILTNTGEKLKAKTTTDKENMMEPVPRDLLPMLFLGHLKEQIVQPYMPLGPVHDKEKNVREKEQDYDIPLHDGMMQPLTP